MEEERRNLKRGGGGGATSSMSGMIPALPLQTGQSTTRKDSATLEQQNQKKKSWGIPFPRKLQYHLSSSNTTSSPSGGGGIAAISSIYSNPSSFAMESDASTTTTDTSINLGNEHGGAEVFVISSRRPAAAMSCIDETSMMIDNTHKTLQPWYAQQNLNSSGMSSPRTTASSLTAASNVSTSSSVAAAATIVAQHDIQQNNNNNVIIPEETKRLIVSITSRLSAAVIHVDSMDSLSMISKSMCGTSLPSVSAELYAERIIRYLNKAHQENGNGLGTVGVRALVLSTLYIDRFCAKNPEFLLCQWNFHRLLFIACLVANKYLEDYCPTNAFMAKVGGLSTQAVSAMEEVFCCKIQFHLYASNEQLDALYKYFTPPS